MLELLRRGGVDILTSQPAGRRCNVRRPHNPRHQTWL